MKRFICNNHMGMMSKGRRIWNAGSRRAFMDERKLQGSGI
jgi:hypothetical protein